MTTECVKSNRAHLSTGASHPCPVLLPPLSRLAPLPSLTTNRTKLTLASACLIGGRAKRLLQSHRDRIDDPEDIKMLEALERNPYANLMVNPVFEDVLEELEEMSGMPDIGPDVVDAHAYAKLAEAYAARDEYVGESLSECGLELIDAYAYDEGNSRPERRELHVEVLPCAAHAGVANLGGHFVLCVSFWSRPLRATLPADTKTWPTSPGD